MKVCCNWFTQSMFCRVMSLDLLHRQRSQLSERMQKLMKSPVDLVSDITRQNMDWMNQLQQTFMAAINPSRPDDERKSEKEKL